MTDNKNDKPSVNRFYVENPEWTYGRKLVVLASDYDRLEAENATLRRRNDQLQEKADDWERAARIARDRGKFTVVK